MTTKMLDTQWTADPTQPGRISAGDAITIDVRVAFWRVPGGDAEAMRLVREAESLCLAAPDMAKALMAMLAEFPSACASDGEISAREDARRALLAAGVTPP